MNAIPYSSLTYTLLYPFYSSFASHLFPTSTIIASPKFSFKSYIQTLSKFFNEFILQNTINYPNISYFWMS